MPRRNLLVLVVVTLVALLCYERVQKNPYGRVLANAMTTIENRYVEPVQASTLFQRAMDGMLGDLDPNSAYITPDELAEFNEEVNQQFVGVGMEVAIDPDAKQLIVLSPIVDSPAFEAGILGGDRILSIDGDSTQGMSLQDAVGLLRGKAGEPVALTIQREGEPKPIEMTVVRGTIQVESVRGDTRNADGSWNFLLQGSDRIGYIRITSFTEKTAEEMEQALDWLSARDMRGLVLDLRDDPGGYIDAAVDVCDMLIRSGVIVTVRRREGKIGETYVASGRGAYTDFPIVVLVNDMSASAAEIVAACLQDNHRATVVGQRTYGKGTVQELIDLEKGCGAMKLTTASYWRPNGQNINRPPKADPKSDWGVSPNDGCRVAVDRQEQNRWRAWRAQRDTYQSNHNGTAKNGTAKKDEKPFIDRPLVRAVECLEKDAR